MILKDVKWTKNKYQELIDYLSKQVDLEYKEFNGNLLNSSKEVIGNNIPTLRKCALEISRGDYSGFIKLNTHKTFEETTIHGLIIGYLKLPIDNTIELLDEFVPFIDNWGTNDVCASNLKIFKCNQEKGYNYISKLLKTNDPWKVRFGLALLLSHYINEQYIDNVLNDCKEINIDHYYVKMGIAWLLSMCFVKYPDKTIKIIENKVLDKWTHNKTIQKIKESLRVDKSTKDMLNTYKIK